MKKCLISAMMFSLVVTMLGTANLNCSAARTDELEMTNLTEEQNGVSSDVEYDQYGNVECYIYEITEDGVLYQCKDTVVHEDGQWMVTTERQVIKSESFSVNEGETIEDSFVIDESEDGILSSDVQQTTRKILLKSPGKAVSATVNLAGAKFAVGAIATAIAAGVSCASSGVFTVVATNVLNFCIGQGLSKVPDSIWYTGTKTSGRSSGRIYNRYNCKFYNSSAKTKYYGSANWSRRWGR